MATNLVHLIPKQHASFIPVDHSGYQYACKFLFTPDAYYFGVVPVLSHTCSQLGVNPLEIGRASLLGQMTVGFPLSPLTASTFLLIGLAEVDLGDHQKFIFKWAWGTTIVMTIVALLNRFNTFMKEKIRIGCGAGFSGDRIEPAVILAEKGELGLFSAGVSCRTYDCFSTKKKNADATKGYDPFLEKRITALIASSC